METTEIVEGLVGWAICLSILFWYINKKRDPSITALSAFATFAGTFFGLVFGGLFTIVFIIYLLDLENARIPNVLGSILGLFIVYPSWQYAMSKIKKTPTKAMRG